MTCTATPLPGRGRVRRGVRGRVPSPQSRQCPGGVREPDRVLQPREPRSRLRREIQVTLLQLSRAFAVLVNGGKLVRLSLAGHEGVERAVPIRPADLALVRGALVDAIESPEGTAHAVAIPGLRYAGKTGSADAPPRGSVDTNEDTWFDAYAPAGALHGLAPHECEDRCEPPRRFAGAATDIPERHRTAGASDRTQRGIRGTSSGTIGSVAAQDRACQPPLAPVRAITRFSNPPPPP